MSGELGAACMVNSVSRTHDLLDLDVHVDLGDLLGLNLHLRCEGFNFAGSIKLRTARWLFDDAVRRGRITPDSILIESSSGNMGVALALVAAGHGLKFVCVTDSRCTAANINLMKALGAEVLVVDSARQSDSPLAARKDRVRRLCAADPRYVWLDQYSNPASHRAHHDSTGPSIAQRFTDLDVLFVGVGTGGTARGCAQYFADTAPHVRVVAVDTVGSVNFGGPPAPRSIPGLGAGEPMPLVDPALFHDVVLVEEGETIRMCRLLASRGLLLGGSSGTVVSAARSWLSLHDPEGLLTAVAIAPDLGDRYLDTIYNDEWVAQHHPEALAPSSDVTISDRDRSVSP